MDYHCVVVYTVINIEPPQPAQSPDTSNGCMEWIKNKMKRALAAVYFESLKLSPNNGVILGHLACLYYKEGLLDLAIETYRQAIEMEPNFPDANCNLGNALKEQGKVEDAEKCYIEALRLCPNHVDTLNNLANVRREQGRIEEATELYKKALEQAPNYAASHNNFASLLQMQGRHAEALKHYKEAISIKPLFADAYSNMGNSLREMQDPQAALNCFRTATEINPLLADAHCNLAGICKDMGRINEAIKSYKKALQIKSNNPDAYCNLAYCLQMVCNWENYDQRMDLINSIVQDQISGGNNVCSVHPHHSIIYPLSNKSRKDIAARYANRIEMSLDRAQISDRTLFPKELSGRLRIGYVSSDFGNHPTSHLMQSIPRMHDRSKVEVFCYALNPDDGSEFRKNILTGSENFVDLSDINCNNEASKIIKRHKINILVNMNGYTRGSRNEIFALRSAPIQVMWLGYPSTSGAEFMDYIITDEISTPMSASEDFSEKFAYMPDSYFVGDHNEMFPHLAKRYNIIKRGGKSNSDSIAVLNAAPFIDMETIFRVKNYDYILSYANLKPIYVTYSDIIIPKYEWEKMRKNKNNQINIRNVLVDNGKCIHDFKKMMGTGEKLYDSIVYTSRHQYNIPENTMVYCNFNQLYKMDPLLMAVWVNILKRVPNSVLWLLAFPSDGKQNLQEYVHKLGLSPDRLIFSHLACKEEHVRRGQLADICLDTLLCNGHTTTIDILWTGTPVLTIRGDTLASRVAASQLTSLNCPELIALDYGNYEEIAVKLGNDSDYLAYIRAKVSTSRAGSTLFECKEYAGSLENLYAKMWARYAGEMDDDHISWQSSANR